MTHTSATSTNCVANDSDTVGADDADTVELASVVDDADWLPYGERPSWSDVTPLPQRDTPEAVVRIAYSPRFVDVYDRVRRVLATGEASNRVLRLLSAAIELNPANYTVWQARRDVLLRLSAPLRPELAFTRRLIEDCPKNYQVWHHRRWAVERLGSADGELRFTEVALARDAKNFHVWQYRQWLIAAFDLFAGELAFIERLIADDVFNNSAWNQRFFVLSRSCDGGGGGDSLQNVQVLAAEIDFCCGQLARAPDNESAWNYARSVLLHCSSGLSGCAPLVELARQQLKQLEERAESGKMGRHAVAFLVDALLEQQEKGDEGGQDDVEEALRLVQLLADVIDPVRRNYWRWQKQTILARCTNSKLTNTEHACAAVNVAAHVDDL